MKLSDKTISLTAEQQGSLMGVLPFISEKGITGIIRFVRNLYKKQNEGAKTVELANKILLNWADTEHKDSNDESVKDVDGFQTWLLRMKEHDSSLVYDDKGEVKEITINNILSLSQETLYLTTDQLSALAVKCFGPDILNAVDWTAPTPTKLVQLAAFLGLPADKAQSLDTVIGIFIGD